MLGRRSPASLQSASEVMGTRADWVLGTLLTSAQDVTALEKRWMRGRVGTPVGPSDPDLVRQMYSGGALALCLPQNPAQGVRPIKQQTQGLEPLDYGFFVEEASLCLMSQTLRVSDSQV